MFCRISSIPNYFNRNSNRNRFISVTFEFVTICDICDQVWPGYKFKIVTYCDWRWPSQMHSVGPTLRSSPRTTFCLLTTCEQAHYISPHELVASSMAGKSARESQRRRGQSRDIKTGQATHLWDPDSAVIVTHIIIIGLHGLFEIGTLSQNRYWFWQRKWAQLLYLGVSPFCTRSRGLVLKSQSLPNRGYQDLAKFWWIVMTKKMRGHSGKKIARKSRNSCFVNGRGCGCIRDSWLKAQFCAILEPNTNAPRMALLSHLLRSSLATIGRDWYSLLRSC